MVQVLKISGAQIDDPAFLAELAQTLKSQTQASVIVHGGGREITDLQTAFGLEAQFIQGLRVTDAKTLALVKMVLCGAVNPRLVELLQVGGLEAQGLSGLDRGLIQAQKYPSAAGDLGFVGEVGAVRADILRDLLAQGVTPVIAPICLGTEGAYNVNADHVAGAVASALGAERVVFLTNVRGVLHNEQVLPVLTPPRAQTLMAEGVISGGMIPKVRTALALLERGVAHVLITDLMGLKIGSGTLVRVSEG
jgi:acetylglutamate kinase